MSVIAGKDVTLKYAGEDGKWNLVPASYRYEPSPEVVAEFHYDMEMLFDKFIVWVRWRYYSAAVDGHGGEKLRRRKHGGRWAKTERGRRKPPLWLAQRKAGL